MKARGWDAVDVVFVSGYAYIDHPSFAAALLGRVFEKEGFRVAILPQPAWNDASAFREFGRPRLCFAASAGNMDSMISHYTANMDQHAMLTAPNLDRWLAHALDCVIDTLLA